MNHLNPLYILLVLQVLDLATTVYFMAHPALGLVEGNPLLARLFAIFGVLPVLVTIKGAVMALCFYLQAAIPDLLVAAICLGYLYVVVNNFKLIREHSK